VETTNTILSQPVMGALMRGAMEVVLLAGASLANAYCREDLAEGQRVGWLGLSIYRGAMGNRIRTAILTLGAIITILGVFAPWLTVVLLRGPAPTSAAS